MFSKSKVSQSMIDAVNKVLGEKVEEQEVKQPEQVDQVKQLDEDSVKVATPTGTRVYGSSYGNSASAVRNQTRHSVDDVKDPKKKDIDKEKDAHLYVKDTGQHRNYKVHAGKFFSNMDDNKSTKGKEEPRYKNEEVQEGTKPDFLDMDKDGNKKESMKKAIADKEVKEELKGDQHKIDANKNDKIDGQDFAILRKRKVKEDMTFANKLLETVRKSDVPAYLRKAKGDTPLTVADVKAPKKDSISAPQNLAKNRNEWKEDVDFTEEQLDEMINEVLGKDATAGDWISDFVHSDNPKFDGKSKAERKKMALGAYYGKQNEATIAGTPGWKEMKKDVKDKSGAVHTPMSRARDLARAAFKKIQKEVK